MNSSNSQQTRRAQIIELLQQQPHSLSALKKLFSLSLSTIEDDVRHIQKSTTHTHKFIYTPPECAACGYLFRKRSRLKKPSRCPHCKSENIVEGTLELNPKSSLNT